MEILSLRCQIYIQSNARDLWNIAREEILYRLYDIEKLNCRYIQHMKERKRLNKFLQQFNIKNKKPTNCHAGGLNRLNYAGRIEAV
jgi:hypothetical protein